jgi:uncharacterized protein (DUF697 family)/predicted GTPase
MLWFDHIWDVVRDGIFDGFWKAIGQATVESDGGAENVARQRAVSIAPVIWLLGKTGSGKTSIVAALTKFPQAEIGPGYKPCTARSYIYDWPSEAPVLRFLDTRGLGEVGYDPAPDIAYAQQHAHVLLVTMKLTDPVQDEVVSVVQSVRHRVLGFPVIVAQTTLHNLYPHGAAHPAEYPYSGTDSDDGNRVAPPQLRKALRYQRCLLKGLTGPAPTFVPLDFTPPEDDYKPPGFGLEALTNALERAGISVLQQLEGELADRQNHEIADKAHPLILGYAAAAAASGAVPIPVIGIAGLAPTIGLLLRALAVRYGVEWDRVRLAEFAGAIGTGALVAFGFQYGIRELMKLIPVAGELAGAALNAAAASALVYALGCAACVYLGSVRNGQAMLPDDVQRAFKSALQEAFVRSRVARAGVPETAVGTTT